MGVRGGAGLESHSRSEGWALETLCDHLLYVPLGVPLADNGDWYHEEGPGHGAPEPTEDDLRYVRLTGTLIGIRGEQTDQIHLTWR